MKPSPRKEHLVATARELFLLKGIRRVSVEAICRSAQVSKRTFYRYFRDKTAVAVAVLDSLFEQGIAILADITADDCSFERKCERILMLLQAEVQIAGSIFLAEITETGSALESHYSALQQHARAMTMDFFRQAQQQGHIDAAVNLDFVLFMIEQFNELVNHPDFVVIMPDIQERSNELITQLFRGFARMTPR